MNTITLSQLPPAAEIKQTMKPITQTNMIRPLRPLCKILWLFALCILACDLNAQTYLPGPNISGTLSPSGNPYIALANLTVPSGTDLALEPGVVLEIASNLTITANGTITAVGTPTQRITIQAPGAASYYWNTITLQSPPGTLNRFHYCDFQNAQTALSIVINNGTGSAEVAEIYNCTFSNCVSEAIYADCGVNDGLSPVIKNCVFSGTSNGCVLIIWYGGNANPTITGNIFQNLTGSALLMTVGNNNSSGGQPIFQNNTIVNCYGGVSASDPWNATVQNNIFVGTTNAITDTGSGTLTRTVGYNLFYNNATNFIGYPSGIYGDALFNNRNGTPCDVLNNIFQNPLFASTTNFYLAANSPCINASAPGQAFENMCFPPSIGTEYGDMGAYGGPDACNWLTNVPLVQVQPSSISASNSLFWVNWYPVPRSSYQIQYATNLVNGSNYWQNLSNGPVEAQGTPTSLSVAPYPATNKMQFYRIQSLGRTPGN